MADEPISAAFDAAVARNADVVRRGRRQYGFLKRLGLSPPVTVEDVKQAFYARAQETHPDRGGDASQFREVQQAFDEAIEYAKRNGKRLPWLGAQLPLYIAQRRAMEQVEAWGGQVVTHQLDWLENTVGVDFAQLADRLAEIDLSGCSVGDAEFSQLVEDPDSLQHLEVLGLANTAVSDASILGVSKAPSLKVLDLRGSAVSIPMRRQLTKLRGMQHVAGTSRLAEWLRAIR